MKKTLFVSALAFLSISSAAYAEPVTLGEGETPHFDVPYGDLNLANPKGAAVMMRRISFAATLACGGAPDIRELRERRMFKTCVRETKEQAVHQLNAPLVTALLLDELAKEEHLASAE